jgi:hypothetical protein
MTSESISESIEHDYWKLAIKKMILVFSCMAIAYFLGVISTLLYYFFFSILTQTSQSYSGIEEWQPLWTLYVILGFLVGLFKAIIDIIKELKIENNNNSSEKMG